MNNSSGGMVVGVGGLESSFLVQMSAGPVGYTVSEAAPLAVALNYFTQLEVLTIYITLYLVFGGPISDGVEDTSGVAWRIMFRFFSFMHRGLYLAVGCNNLN